MITTSRKPSPRLTQFAKEIKLLFPGAQRMNRGNHVLKELIEASRRHGITDVVIVHETRGQPDGLVVSHLPYGPTAYFSLANVVMRHDIRDGVERFPYFSFLISKVLIICLLLILTSFLTTSRLLLERSFYFPLKSFLIVACRNNFEISLPSFQSRESTCCYFF